MTETPGLNSYGWVTVLVIRHHAGSEEGAIFQRNRYDALIEDHGGEVTMASTKPGDAAGVGLSAFFAAAGEDGDDAA